LASARAEIAKKDVDAARISLKNALQQEPGNAEARFLLGQVLLESGDAVGAELELRRALEQRHPEAKVLPLLVTAMLAQNKAPVLLQQFGKTRLEDAEADARVQTLLASAEALSGDLTAAATRVDAVLAARPEDAPAVLLRARLTAAGGQPAEALAQIDKLLARQADNADAWQLKGDLLRQAAVAAAVPGKAASSPAADAYREAVKHRPDNIGAQAALVGMMLSDGDKAGAEAQWKTMQKLAPRHPQTLLLEAGLSAGRGDYKHVRELTQLLLRAMPNNTQALILGGEAELQLGNPQQAEVYFQKALQASPGNGALRLQQAVAQMRTGQTDKALTTLTPLLDGKAATVEALTLAAQAQLIKGDMAGADASLARAARIKPDDLRVRMAIALSALAKGKGAPALADLRAVAAADKGTTADLALIEVQMRAKDLDGARKAVDVLATKTPDDPLVDHLRGRIAMQAGDAAGARQQFEAALKRQPDHLPAMAALAGLDLNDKQPAAAKARFEALVQRDPKNVGALLALAELAARTGAPSADVGKLLADAVAADPTIVASRVMLADHQLASNQPKAALETVRVGLAASPDQPELLERQGRALMASGDPMQAVTSFTKLAGLLPRSAGPQLLLADAQNAARNPTAAATAVRKAVELAPDSLPVMQAQIGQALRDNRIEQALEVARKVQARAPDEGLGYAMEGNVELRRQKWDAAAAVLQKAVVRKRPGDAPQLLHAALVGGGKTAEAEAFVQEWRKKQPEDLTFVQAIGDQAMAAGKFAAAEAAYREVVNKWPKAVPALNNLAYAMAMQKKPGAVQIAEQAAELAPRSPAVLDTLAIALAAEQKWPQAIEAQKKAVDVAPEANNYRLGLARLLLQSGDKAGARSELSALSALGNKYPRQAEVAAMIKQADE
jgi:putative PEP-CTERM system TPR-repeat lipoprotein